MKMIIIIGGIDRMRNVARKQGEVEIWIFVSIESGSILKHLYAILWRLWHPSIFYLKQQTSRWCPSI